MKTHYPPSAPPTWYKQEVQTASSSTGNRWKKQVSNIANVLAVLAYQLPACIAAQSTHLCFMLCVGGLRVAEAQIE